MGRALVIFASSVRGPGADEKEREIAAHLPAGWRAAQSGPGAAGRALHGVRGSRWVKVRQRERQQHNSQQHSTPHSRARHADTLLHMPAHTHLADAACAPRQQSPPPPCPPASGTPAPAALSTSTQKLQLHTWTRLHEAPATGSALLIAFSRKRLQGSHLLLALLGLFPVLLLVPRPPATGRQAWLDRLQV